MSKERELLKRVRDTLLGLKETHYDLYWDIQTALDLREDLRENLQEEPVAWMYDHQLEVGYDKYTEVNIIETCARNLESNNCINIRPLYLAPPKREPLSDYEIAKLWANKSPANEFECVRLVEKAHGIGGGYL